MKMQKKMPMKMQIRNNHSTIANFLFSVEKYGVQKKLTLLSKLIRYGWQESYYQNFCDVQ